jgi:hypothetical protein
VSTALDADTLVATATATATATARAGREDFGGTSWREGLDRRVDALGREADRFGTG